MTDFVDDMRYELRTSWPKLAVAGALGFTAGVAVLSGRKLGMQMTSAVAADWLRQLKIEHRIAEGLFKAGLKTKPHETAKRTALYGHLYYALLKHGVQEETT
ncbi:MAG: hemerythrin domain-containing protein, partial [Caulobacteraceae bacterium]|nr:hemerythrin domain-containing protein [Caulobacteraceae bacterium]